ncbi:MAG TPA: putative metal-dependent hydrolase [Longimicrobiaceae bacterium]|nr:putative metal-dependent hydrolase [Longimicrobiaceae bacterium]
MTEDLRYPVGRFDTAARPGPDDVRRWIEEIAGAPAQLRAAVEGLSAEQLDTAYRPGGWTVRQVVHHVPDSHANAYVRFKLALTEEAPVIKPYEEARWAELEDTRATPVEVSLALLDALHHRWVLLLRSLGPDDLARVYRHPELGTSVRLDSAVGLYAWHGRHHVAHVVALRERMGWG